MYSRAVRRVVVIAWLLGAVVASAQPASPPPPKADPAVEAKFRADVEAASAEAAKAFDEGNAARDAGRGDEAIAAYKRASELAPNLDHPHRRLCGVLVASRVDEGISSCERAIALRPDSPYNKSAFATALLTRAAPGDVERALTHAREAAEAMPKDVQLLEVWCRATLQSGLAPPFAQCAERLLALDPDGMQANFFGAIVAGDARDYDEAHRLLRKARDAGLPNEMYEALRAGLEKFEADERLLPIDSDTALEIGLVTLGAWLVFLILLFVIGSALSQATLRTVYTVETDTTGTAREKRLRRMYRFVLVLAGVYFYLSLPIVIVGVIASAIGVILLFDEMGGIPIYLLFLIGLTVIMTIVAIVRSVIVRADETINGRLVDLVKYPKLRTLLDEVANAIGTRSVDAVYFVPGTELGVIERGSLWRAFRGKPSERVLLLGVALFDAMTLAQLRSILAHEYGHFHNADTSGIGFAVAVRRSLGSLVERMAKSGIAHWFNPAWWFVLIFSNVYLGISHGASRLQEVLADRWAVRAYGTAAFVSGYRHSVARDVEFSADLAGTVHEVIANQWSLVNVYEVEPADKKSDAELAAEIEKAMNKLPDRYDSHPTPVQRIALAEQLAVTREVRADDETPVWELFDDPEAIERAMTGIIRDNIHEEYGVIVPDRDEDHEAA